MNKRAPTVLAEKRREVFLKILAKTGKVIEAARAVGLQSTTVLYEARNDDEEFAAKWDAAILASADLLEEAAWDRAVNGVEKPILFKGEVVASETVYSDSILLAMLASRKKEYRKSSQVDVNLEANVHVGVAVIPMVAADSKDWERQAHVVHDNQKMLPAFTDPGAVEGEFTEVTEKAAAEPASVQRTLGRG